MNKDFLKIKDIYTEEELTDVEFYGKLTISILPTLTDEVEGDEIELVVMDESEEEYEVTMILEKDAKGYFVRLNNRKSYISKLDRLPLARR